MLEEDKRGILLESGTNEIEVMEFTILDNLYGINVAKVKEILVSEPVKPMPHAHPAVEGIFKPRDTVITVVDLPKYLFGQPGEKGPKDLFIITSFNKMNIAFRVHSVVGISRISWRDIQKPDNAISGGKDGVATGIAQCGDDLVTILTQPKNALVKQYQKLLEYDDVDLEFTPESLEAVADKAIERNIGARGLRAVMEGVLTQLMYDIPSDHTIEKVTITADCVKNGAQPEIIRDPEHAVRRAKLKTGKQPEKKSSAPAS